MNYDSNHRSPNQALTPAQGGFTLIELMIAVVILSIAVTIVIPSFSDFIDRNRAAAETNRFLAALQTARSEAVNRGRNISICARKKDGDSCAVGAEGTGDCVCSGDGLWEHGWFVYLNDAGDALMDVGDTLLFVGEPLSGQTTLRRNGSATQQRTMLFNSRGQAPAAATFSLCPPIGSEESDEEEAKKKARFVVVNFAGRPDVRTIEDTLPESINKASVKAACQTD